MCGSGGGGCYAYCAPGVAEIGGAGRESCDYSGWCCAKCDTRGGCAARNVVGGSKRRGITGIAPDRGQGQHRTALAGTDLYEVVGVGVGSTLELCAFTQCLTHLYALPSFAKPERFFPAIYNIILIIKKLLLI